jgi:hypothetical protein
MAEAGVCKCGFEGRAAVAGYARMVLASAMVVTTAMAAGAAALDPRPAEYETIVPFVFWAILALTLATDVAAVWANVRLADCSRGAHLTATGAWPWLFLLIVFSAVPVLFAAGPSMPAVVLEIYLLGRIVIEGTFAGHRAGMFADSDPDTLDPEVTLRCMRTAIRYAGVRVGDDIVRHDLGCRGHRAKLGRTNDPDGALDHRFRAAVRRGLPCLAGHGRRLSAIATRRPRSVLPR